MRVHQTFNPPEFLKNSDSKETINQEMIFSEDFL